MEHQYFLLVESESESLMSVKHSRRFTALNMRTWFTYFVSLTCTTREQMLPAKQWWKSSIKHQSTSSPTRQREPSFPCSTQCPKSAGRWRVRATPSLRASWESAWQSMDGIWVMTPTLVRTALKIKRMRYWVEETMKRAKYTAKGEFAWLCLTSGWR